MNKSGSAGGGFSKSKYAKDPHSWYLYKHTHFYGVMSVHVCKYQSSSESCKSSLHPVSDFTQCHSVFQSHCHCHSPQFLQMLSGLGLLLLC